MVTNLLTTSPATIAEQLHVRSGLKCSLVIPDGLEQLLVQLKKHIGLVIHHLLQAPGEQTTTHQTRPTVSTSQPVSPITQGTRPKKLRPLPLCEECLKSCPQIILRNQSIYLQVLSAQASWATKLQELPTPLVTRVVLHISPPCFFCHNKRLQEAAHASNH